MIQTLKLLLDTRNYREVASLWLVGSMFGTAIGLFHATIGNWMLSSSSRPEPGIFDFIAFWLYIGGLFGGPWLGWRLHARQKYGLAMLAGCVPALICVLGLMWMMRGWSELA